MAGRIAYLVETDQHLLIFDYQGTELMKHRWPRPGTSRGSDPSRGTTKVRSYVVTAGYRVRGEQPHQVMRGS
ncbi:MAG: hypothetical protein ABJB03_06840 [Rhodoglobus sp.]